MISTIFSWAGPYHMIYPANSKFMVQHHRGFSEHEYLICLMGNLLCFFVICQLFSKSTFSKNSFRNAIRVSNSLNPDQARRLVRPELGPNCLQTLSADETTLIGK